MQACSKAKERAPKRLGKSSRRNRAEEHSHSKSDASPPPAISVPKTSSPCLPCLPCRPCRSHTRRQQIQPHCNSKRNTNLDSGSVTFVCACTAVLICSVLYGLACVRHLQYWSLRRLCILQSQTALRLRLRRAPAPPCFLLIHCVVSPPPSHSATLTDTGLSSRVQSGLPNHVRERVCEKEGALPTEFKPDCRPCAPCRPRPAQPCSAQPDTLTFLCLACLHPHHRALLPNPITLRQHSPNTL